MDQPLSLRSRTSIVLWLLTGCFLIFAMVVVGGITRLTGSGLSITKWDVVTGTLPPFSEQEWMVQFNHYQETPQFKHINSHFGIEEFKSIYWWEYIHRLLGRLIGVVFLIPFIWFVAKKQIRGILFWKCLLLFFMGGLKGFIGLYMVKSGLVDVPQVSHFRLALHLSTAFLTFGLTFWFAFQLIHTEKFEAKGWQITLKKLVNICFAIISLQIIYGAFVAGLKAGYIYNTWPLMGDKMIADSVWYGIEQSGIRALVDNPSGVQFVHRYLATIVALFTIGIGWYALKKRAAEEPKLLPGQKSALRLMGLAITIQFTLGVITILTAVPFIMGVLHQVGAFFLLTSFIYLMHRLRRQSIPEANSRL